MSGATLKSVAAAHAEEPVDLVDGAARAAPANPDAAKPDLAKPDPAPEAVSEAAVDAASDATAAAANGASDGAAPDGTHIGPFFLPAGQASLSISLGTAYWEGDYGGPTNGSVIVGLLNVRQRIGDLRLDGTLPWIRIRSDSAIFTGIDGTPLVVAPGGQIGQMTPRNRQGLGDLTLGASWLAARQDVVGIDVDLSGRVKLPTAGGSTRLSTGQTDFSFGVEVSRAIGEITPMARLNYRVLGDGNGWVIKDGFAGSVGASMMVSRRVVVQASYDYAQRAGEFIADSHEIVGGFSAPLNDRLRLTAYASAGLSSGAAGFATGVSVSFSLFR